MLSIWLTRHPRLIIFDQYKTLTEGGSDPEAAIIKHFALTLPYADVERVVCGTLWENDDQYLDAVVAGLALDDHADTRVSLRDILHRDVASERLVQNARSVLQTLRHRGLRLALLSNAATPAYTHATVEGSGIADLFDVAIYSHAVGIPKPDAAIFQTVLAATGVAAEDALMVGDSLRNDFEASLAAGIGQAVLLDSKGLHPDVHPQVRYLEELLDLLPDFAPPPLEAIGVATSKGYEVDFAVQPVESKVDESTSPLLKEQGNDHFKAKRFADAISCYSKAADFEVAHDYPSGKAFCSQLYANRAACHLALHGDADESLRDAGYAIQLDGSSCKAHFRKGKAFLHMCRYEDALDSFENSRRLRLEPDAALDELILECSSHVEVKDVIPGTRQRAI